MLDLKGVPTIVERTFIRPPAGRLGPITPDERKTLLKNSPVYGEYDETVDRESAYEKLQVKAERRDAAEAEEAQEKEAVKTERKAATTARREPQSATDRFVKGVAGSVGRQIGTSVARSIGNALVRGILGSLTRR